MNRYSELRNRQQEEINALPIMFAFSNKQFDEGMRKLGLEPTDTDKIYSIGGGGYIRKTDSDSLHEMINRHADEIQKEVDGDQTGEGFIYEMFLYELSNHEFGYTGDVEDTLDALDLTFEDIENSPNLKHGLKKAIRKFRHGYEY